MKENKFEEPVERDREGPIIVTSRNRQKFEKEAPFTVVFEIPVVSDDELVAYQEEVAAYEKEKKKKLKELQQTFASNTNSYGMARPMFGYTENAEDDDEADPTKL